MTPFPRFLTTTTLVASLWLFGLNNNKCLVQAQLRDEIQFEYNSVKLPLKLSDMMANYVPGPGGDDETGYILLTGGCDAPKGNERLPSDNEEEQDLFACLSTSDITLRFDPWANRFTEMAPMPHARQRHAAVVVGGGRHLVVLGGRDANDDLVTAIDVYNPETNEWTTQGNLPDEYVTSDLTAWTWENFVYVTGGFQFNYTAVGTTFRLPIDNTAGGSASVVNTAELQVMATSPHPRGDFHAVTLFGYAYLAGGITHTSLWCEGLTTTERYHMATDTWEELSPLANGRADMAVAVLNNKIVSIGGETKPEDCVERSDPAYGSFPRDHVEVLLHHANSAGNDDAQWVPFAKFVDQRFRFAAAVVPAQNRLYTFGGQLPFDFTCDCFPTSDDVVVGTEVYSPVTDNSLDPGAIAAIVLGSFVGMVICVWVLYKVAQTQNKQRVEARSATDFEQNKQGDME